MVPQTRDSVPAHFYPAPCRERPALVRRVRVLATGLTPCGQGAGFTKKDIVVSCYDGPQPWYYRRITPPTK